MVEASCLRRPTEVDGCGLVRTRGYMARNFRGRILAKLDERAVAQSIISQVKTLFACLAHPSGQGQPSSNGQATVLGWRVRSCYNGEASNEGGQGRPITAPPIYSLAKRHDPGPIAWVTKNRELKRGTEQKVYEVLADYDLSSWTDAMNPNTPRPRNSGLGPRHTWCRNCSKERVTSICTDMTSNPVSTSCCCWRRVIQSELQRRRSLGYS
ncbi:hypothetical protein BDM02DRAFT_3124633 [Thelephora ganbajun]|uniref:Uncharacterized protein n=1 Tax=Thelephora ganbajun TaxID=370292 RepID=A0ACB6YY41_THEGA|nr:hypothetical protein BDM02DRAFT_3124633 [Thelephora ganbajun]